MVLNIGSHMYVHVYNLMYTNVLQLSEPKVVKMKELLEKSQSSYSEPFKAMLKRVDEGDYTIYSCVS